MISRNWYESSLEWAAPIEDEFSVDREFLEPPALYLDKIRANEPDCGYISVGDILVSYKATHNGPVIGLRLWVHVCKVEFNMIMAQGGIRQEPYLHEMLRYRNNH